MKGCWPLVVLLAVAGCGDSKTASLEREVDSLKGQVARLKEENAALRERATALSMDLDYQKSQNRKHRAIPEEPPAVEPERRAVSPPIPSPVTPEAPPAAVGGENPPPQPIVAPAPEGGAPTPAPKPAEPVVSAPKPQVLPDIRPQGATKKAASHPQETLSKTSAQPKAEKPEPSAQPPVERPQPPGKPESARLPKPASPQEDMYAPFRRPGYKEPPAPPEADEPRQDSPKAAPSSPESAPEKPHTAQKKPPRISAPPSDLQLVDVSDSRNGNVVQISGFVVNNTAKEILNVRIKAAFLDDAGEVITSREYSIEGGDRLDGGDRASFEIASPDSPRIAKYRLIVRGDQSR